MAIQQRRGSYANFDKSKLIPGEPAVVLSGDPNATDGKAAYIAFGSGDVKRLATDEDLASKVDKTQGKGLSTNDYTTEEKNKLNGIENQANKTIVDSALSDTSTNPVQNKVVKAGIDDVKDKLNQKADVIISSASGSIAHFKDGAEADAKSVIAHIEPAQEGSGDPSPDNVRPITGHTEANVVRTGKNLLPYPYYWDTRTVNGITFTVNTDGTVGVKGTATATAVFYLRSSKSGNFGLIGGETYFFTGCPAIGSTTTYKMDLLDTTQAAITNEYGSGRTVKYDATRTPGAMRIVVYSGVTLDVVFKPMVRLAYDTDDTYEPYQDTTYYPITFPTEAGTIYGGYVDVTNGELVVDRANIASYSGQTLPGEWISDRDVYTPGGTPTTEAQVVYKLAEPVVYNITPQQITTLLGTNNIWNDVNGDTDVEYKADTKLYIEHLTKPTEDDMTANANIASGKFFMVGNRLFLSTSAIASGDTINPGTNCTELSLADALNNLN